MKRKATRLLALFLAVLTLVSPMAISVSAGDVGGATSSPSISDVGEIINAISYSEYREKYASYGKGEKEIPIVIGNYKYEVNGESKELEFKDNYGAEGEKDSGLYIPQTGTVTWEFDVEKAGNFIIEIKYCQAGDKTNSIERVFYINGKVPFSEARSIVLTKVWTYDYEYDADGNRVHKH